jgi:hypothetical protein
MSDSLDGHVAVRQATRRAEYRINGHPAASICDFPHIRLLLSAATMERIWLLLDCPLWEQPEALSRLTFEHQHRGELDIGHNCRARPIFEEQGQSPP